MTFYHGTTEEEWMMIQKEGMLYGRRIIVDGDGNPSKLYKPSRCTYLAIDIDEAKCYGEVVLQVEYNPFKKGAKNNYTDGCWQVRVYEPIPLESVKKIN